MSPPAPQQPSNPPPRPQPQAGTQPGAKLPSPPAPSGGGPPATGSPPPAAGQPDQPPPPKPYRICTGTTPRLKIKQEGTLFCNPYNFIPFREQPLPRAAPTPRCADDRERERFTGCIELELELVTPLLSSDPTPQLRPLGQQQQGKEHKVYQALTVSGHPVLPATGVRGALRSMLEAICGAGVAVLADHIWLWEGRHANGRIGENAVLAEIVEPGGIGRPGRIRLGETRSFISATSSIDPHDRTAKHQWQWKHACLQNAHGKIDDPASLDRQCAVWANETFTSFIVATPAHLQPNALHPWRVKVSGKPVPPPARHPMTQRPIELAQKEDAAFRRLPDSPEIEIPAALWEELLGVNYGGLLDQRSKLGGPLKPHDLIWVILKPEHTVAQLGGEMNIRAEHIRCLSWTRWPRQGSPLHKRMPQYTHPPGWSADGTVDGVADLFGAVPLGPGRAAKRLAAFAGRIRPDNLVFPSDTIIERGIALAPLLPPHPSNRAFYRQSQDPETVCCADNYVDQNGNLKQSPHPADWLRGYKVYLAPPAGDRPWPYREQPVFGPDGQALPPHTQVNRTVDLIAAGSRGRVTLAVRGLSAAECALLRRITAPGFPWRLGGGKPLGLGCARVVSATWRDEQGRPLPEAQLAAWDKVPIASRFGPDLERRIGWWRRSQQPAPAKLRYPRAQGQQRGGHAWFNKLAKGKMNQPWGLQEYADQPGQLLPHLTEQDLTLPGYDARL